MLDTRRVLFPLRSNIAYFDTARVLDIEARVKQMALLADELLFEPGVLKITQVADGVWESWMPPEALREEEIRQMREVTVSGQPMEIRIGIQPAKGVPARYEDSVPIMGGSIGRAFIAEFHLLAQESGLDNVAWVQWPVLTAEGEAELQSLKTESECWDFSRDRDFPTVVDDPLLDRHLRTGLNRDLALSAATNVPAVVDELHRPILEFKIGMQQEGIDGGSAVGAEALHLWAPNFTALPWKRIIELHDHGAIGEFRAKIAEAEEECAGLSEGERLLALKDIGYQAALLKAARLMPDWTDVAVDAGVGALIDIVPWGGTIYDVAAGVAKVRRERSDWTSVLLALNDTD